MPDGYRLIRINTANVGIKMETCKRLKELKRMGKVRTVNSFVQQATEEKLKRDKL